jgi:hypothetical protein
MSRALRIQYPDAYYHVTCRGMNGRKSSVIPKAGRNIFACWPDLWTFFTVRLLGYALIHNHFHLLVCTSKGNLSEFMRIEEVKELLGKNQEDEKSVREQPALRELQQSIAPENLIDRYALLVKMTRTQLTAKGKQSIERSMLMELLYRRCKITQPEIGRLLGGIDYSAKRGPA